MSASLVGSEMCIRDSSRSGPSTFVLAPTAPAGTSTSRVTARRRSGSWAVSYTHLTLPTICSV
eukprot:8053887-Alexandrium_andersonii.AAC.1